MDKVKVKKTISRIGFVAVSVGVVLVAIGGGDPESALRIAGILSGISGTVLELIREIMN